MPTVAFLLLMAERDAEFRRTLAEMMDVVRAILPVDLEVREASSAPETRAALTDWRPDALLLDWNVAAEGTVAFVRELQDLAPGIRIMVMLPEAAGEYRRAVWAAGACAGLPRDRLDAECFAAALCIMQRAKHREAALRSRPTEPGPVCAEVSP
jgi:DNA-binding NarL/FixJ family response regulator